MSVDKSNPPYYDGDACMRKIAELTAHMKGDEAFCLGQGIKYIWRAGRKDGESGVDDLDKASWYLQWYAGHELAPSEGGMYLLRKLREIIGYCAPELFREKIMSLTARSPSTLAFEGEQGYLQLLRTALHDGERRENRTGIDTLSLFGVQLSFDLTQRFPIFTTKKVWWKGVSVELDWMLQGKSNVAYLQEHGVGIWDAWAKADYRPELGHPEGELGPVYGAQWRHWPRGFDANSYMDDLLRVFRSDPEAGVVVLRKLHKKVSEIPAFGERAAATGSLVEEAVADVLRGSSGGIGWAIILATHMAAELNAQRQVGTIDQIEQIVAQLRRRASGEVHSDDRRILLSAWNVGDVPMMKLPPCHYAAQFLVDGDLGLTTIVSIRSWDLFLGAPFNVAQYALLTSVLAHICGLSPRRLVLNAGDAHIYVNHTDAVTEQCSRTPIGYPQVRIDDAVKEIDDFRFHHALLTDYTPQAPIKGEVAV